MLYIIVLFLGQLEAGASQFEQNAGKIKRKMWWKNVKVCLFN